jgi:hypothetical protein
LTERDRKLEEAIEWAVAAVFLVTMTPVMRSLARSNGNGHQT